MANKDQTEKMCVSYLGSNDETDPADVSEPTIRHSSVMGPEQQTMQNDTTPRNKMDQIAHRIDCICIWVLMMKLTRQMLVNLPSATVL